MVAVVCTYLIQNTYSLEVDFEKNADTVAKIQDFMFFVNIIGVMLLFVLSYQILKYRSIKEIYKPILMLVFILVILNIIISYVLKIDIPIISYLIILISSIVVTLIELVYKKKRDERIRKKYI